MKRFTTLFFLLILVQISSIQIDVNSIKSDQIFQSIESNSQYTEFEFQLDSYNIENIERNNSIYQKITHENCGYLVKEGLPELPLFSTMIAIPNQGSFSVEIIDEEIEILPNTKIIPSQGLDEENARSFHYNVEFYDGNLSYPEQSLTASDPIIMRDYRLVNFSFSPFQYNAEKQEVVLRKSAKFRVNYSNERGENELIKQNNLLSRSFENLYKSTILNYDEIRDENPEYQKKSILIVHSSNSSINQPLEYFVNLKRNKGFEVTAVSTSETGNNTNSIKSYIQNAYDTWETPPEYVILIGDASSAIAVPTYFETLSTYYGEGDHPYTLLDGNDYFSDVLIGRISLGSSADFWTYIAKVILFEVEPNMDDLDYYQHSTLIGDPDTASGISPVITTQYIEELMLNYNPNYNLDVEIQYGFLNATIEGINEGSSFWNYRGIYGVSGFEVSHILNLNNYSKMVNSVLLTCGTGSFAEGFSRTEAFIRAGTATNPTGGATSIGLSTTGTHTRYNNILDGGIFHGIFADNMKTMGEALVRGEIALYSAYAQNELNTVKYFTHWCNLMGDPSLEIFTGVPIEMEAIYENEISKGTNFLDVSVFDEFENPINDAWVTIRLNDDEIFATDYTDENGNVTLYFEGNFSGEANLTITKAEHKPIINTVIISDEGGIGFENCLIDDDNNGASQGNGNGEINPGEIVEMAISLKNYSNQSISNVSAQISISDDFVEIIEDTANFGDFSSGAIQVSQSNYILHFDENMPNNYNPSLLLTATDVSGNIWESRINLTISGHDLDIEEVVIIDGANSILDPSETAFMEISLINNGKTNLSNVYGTIESLDQYLTINDNIANFGNIQIGETIVCNVDNFQISAKSILVPGMKVQLKLNIYNDSGYFEEEFFEIEIGEKTINDPTGPDNYGYFCYNNNDIGYLNTQNYNWIEINPQFGGNGINTGISDNGYEQDEIVTEDLDFDFKFYGETYDKISICSNGFIALGESNQATFRNWPLPGPLGPSPMIAAFWDELFTIDGGIYTYFDPTEHIFIIEWSNVKNSQNYSQEFQIILYDSFYYPTGNGDGMIKIQYKTFNNTNSGGYQHPHGKYCTIGIENHDGSDGLEYTYNNDYSTSSNIITNNSALVFTTSPIVNEGIYLLLNEIIIHDSQETGSFVAGENVDLGIRLLNYGESDASGIFVNISSSDPDLTIINGSSTYANILAGTTGTNNSFFTLCTSENVENEQRIPLDIEVFADTLSWYYQYMLTVSKPSISFDSFIINDSYENSNGIADPGETIALVFNILNETDVDAGNVSLELTTQNPNTTILNDTFLLGKIKAESFIQGVFDIEISSSASIGELIEFNLNIQSENSNTVETEVQIMVSTAPELISEDFTTWLPNGWSIDAHSQNWSQSVSAQANGQIPEAKLSYSPTFVGTTRLITNPLNLVGATNISMTFNHYLDHWGGNNGYSIGVAYRINGGEWNSIWEVTPSNDIGPEIKTINLDESLIAFPEVEFCFYLDGNSYNLNYWYLDDFNIDAIIGNSGIISGHITLGNQQNDVSTSTMSLGDFSTHADTDGNYILYSLAGNYEELIAECEFHERKSIEDIQINSGGILTDYDFDLNYLIPPENLLVSVNGIDADLSWDYSQRNLIRNATKNEVIYSREEFSHFDIYRQEFCDNFVKIGSTSDLVFADEIQSNRIYRYYIEAIYEEGVSEKSNVVVVGENSSNTYGDIDDNGLIQTYDAALTIQYAVGLDPLPQIDPLPWEEWRFVRADVDGNEVIQSYDSALILQYAVGLISQFPVEQLRFISPEASVDYQIKDGFIEFYAFGELIGFDLNIKTIKGLSFEEPEILLENSLMKFNETNLRIGLSSIYPIKEGSCFMKIPFTIDESITDKRESKVILEITANTDLKIVELDREILNSGSQEIVRFNKVYGNFPNPFNPETTIKFSVKEDNTKVKIEIYNLKGQLVKVLQNEKLNRGYHKAIWTGNDKKNKKVASGVYFYRAEIGETITNHKMILIK